VSLSVLARVADPSTCDLVSTDLFDTLLLRDRSTESGRLAEAAHRAARHLGLEPGSVVGLRWTLHANAYRSVAIERPQGEASLSAITSTMARAFGLGQEAADVFRRTEVEVDCQHLRPNVALLEVLERIRDTGVRVIAVSDSYYEEDDLRGILSAVVGEHPLHAVYSSADARLTKHAGGIFTEVAEREAVKPHRIVHVGDNSAADVEQATAAGWVAVSLPRSSAYLVSKRLGHLLALPVLVRRAR
jgi:FMN phosphatase YigB (HAD superfamily)